MEESKVSHCNQPLREFVRSRAHDSVDKYATWKNEPQRAKTS